MCGAIWSTGRSSAVGFGALPTASVSRDEIGGIPTASLRLGGSRRRSCGRHRPGDSGGIAERDVQGELDEKSRLVVQLIAARNAEVAERLALVIEKAKAEANFRKRRQAVDDYFTLVSESRLFDVPGLQPLRKQLLEAALKFYESFVNQRGHEPQLQAELAAILLSRWTE